LDFLMAEADAARRITLRDGASLEVESGGPEGAPAVLLVPGLGYGTSLWSAQVPALAERYRWIAVCPRGSGRSDPAPADWSVAGMAADLFDVQDAFGLPTAHLAGSSLGGLVCLEAARRSPERVRSLILLSTALIVETADFDPEVLAILQAVSSQPSPENARRGVEAALAPLPAEAPPEVRATREARIDRILEERWKSPPTPEGYRAQAMAGALYMAARLAPSYVGPALVISGAADRVIPARRSRELAAGLPGARYLEIAGAGHLVQLEKPEVVNLEMLAFLAGVG
jgi:pimeloyl-ACP methyl ester carboxylesterase